MNTCFVCLDDEDENGIRSLFKVCACETRIHKSCFIRLVTDVHTHKTQCPVCLKPYTHVSRDVVTHSRIRREFWYVLFLYAIFVSMFVPTSMITYDVLLVQNSDPYQYAALFCVLVYIYFTSQTLYLATVAYRRRTGGWAVIERVERSRITMHFEEDASE